MICLNKRDCKIDVLEILRLGAKKCCHFHLNLLERSLQEPWLPHKMTDYHKTARVKPPIGSRVIAPTEPNILAILMPDTCIKCYLGPLEPIHPPNGHQKKKKKKDPSCHYVEENHLAELFSNFCPPKFVRYNGCYFKSLSVVVVTWQLLTRTYWHVWQRQYNNLKYMKLQTDTHIQWKQGISFNKMNALNGFIKGNTTWESEKREVKTFKEYSKQRRTQLSEKTVLKERDFWTNRRSTA